jgi:DNA replication and repair protein RecF
MPIEKLSIRHFRNLVQVDLEPAPDINVITGQNASGKTSLLEAIYFLGRAASFRTSRFERILQRGQDSLSVFARVANKNGKKVPIGIQKGQKKVQIHINEQKVNKVSELVFQLPIQVIHPNSHRLMEEGPQFRRRFLDWGVFHVEHEFLKSWQNYQRVLKQRNTAIRQHSSTDLIQAWDRELVDAANSVTAYRRRYIEGFQQSLDSYITPILGKLNVMLEFRQGWDSQLPFEQAIKQSLQQDRERGFTTIGPHRADIVVRVDGLLAQERISRGQQKMLVTSLLLTQAGHFMQQTGKDCVLLIDDVAAELDQENQERLFGVLAGMDVQMFLSAIEPINLEQFTAKNKQSQVFHVEHGVPSNVLN